jgi:hypothetical protein
LFVDSAKGFIFFFRPDFLEVFESFKTYASYPFEELFGIGEFLSDGVTGGVVVEYELVLGVAEVAQNVFGVAGELA